MKLITLLSLPLLLSSTALAHDIKSPSNNSVVKGMNYLTITKSATQNNTATVDEETEEEPPIEPSKDTQDQIKSALEKPLIEKKKQAEIEKKEKAYFTKHEDLHEWGHLRSLLSASQEEQSLAIKELEKAPDQASPMILLLASDFYFKQGNKEKAALYFLASKLRAEFDMKRWTIINDSGLETRKKPHPAKEVIKLSRTLSNELSGWILSNKHRAQILFKALDAWEKETGYSYLPTYELNNEEFNFIEAEKLIKTRDKNLKNFIKKQNDTLSLIHP